MNKAQLNPMETAFLEQVTTFNAFVLMTMELMS